MKTIKEDIEHIKEIILKDFSDPFEENSLINFLSNGSKYVRSKLALLYFRANNFDITNKVYKILVAGEIIHNASLLHDDVIDGATTRRGEPTLGEKYSEKISILSGDYLLSYAIEKLLDLNNLEILRNFNICTKAMANAEIRQYLLRGNIPSENEYIEICTGKTAALFSSIFKSCAIILDKDTSSASDFGKYYGLCFQIKNDLDLASATIDKTNKIYTAKDVLGIEKTQSLLDNYKSKLLDLISNSPNKIYKEYLEKAIREL